MPNSSDRGSQRSPSPMEDSDNWKTSLCCSTVTEGLEDMDSPDPKLEHQGRGREEGKGACVLRTGQGKTMLQALGMTSPSHYEMRFTIIHETVIDEGRIL